MDWFFIPEPCFPKDIVTEHLSHFMVHGTGHRKNKKDISWCSNHSKMVSPMGIGKSLPIISPGQMISVLRDRHYTAPADLLRDLMLQSMFQMKQRKLFTE